MKSELKLHIQTAGNPTNSPIVLLHGFMEDLSMWNNFVPFLAEKYFVLRIDLPGHGKSDCEISQSPSIQTVALQIIESLGVYSFETCRIVGHSLGGYVGLELMNCDSRFTHLTLLHSQPWADSEEKRVDRERVAAFVKTKSELFIQEAIPHLFAHPNQHSQTIQRYMGIAKKMHPSAIIWSTLAMKNRSNLEHLMEKSPQKFTFIQGEKDALIPKEKTLVFASKNNIEYIEIQDCGHMSHEESPTELSTVFQQLLG